MSREYKTNGEILPGEQLPEGLVRVAAVVEYDGTDYRGFQIQRHDSATVQEHLHRAFANVAAEPISLVCAGRTDAGVHASNQVIHFDTSAHRPVKAWVKGVNTQLPRDIRIRWAGDVSAQFHARFSAKARSYRYLISDQAVKPGVLRNQVSWSRWPLDLAQMAAGASYLLGEQDFSSFRASQCQARHAIREMQAIDIYRVMGGLIVIEVRANAFLHHMVRNIVGALMMVGSGRREPNWIESVLAAKDRRAADVTAPASGLYFVAAHYPAELALPAQPLGPMFLPNSLHDVAEHFDVTKANT